jgi:hypothetical protein
MYANHLHIMGAALAYLAGFCTSKGDLMFREGLQLLEASFPIRIDDWYYYAR